MNDTQMKRHRDFLQFSLFKSNLYARFPHKSSEIDQVYNEFCMLYESDYNNLEIDKERKNSSIKESEQSEERKEHESPKSSWKIVRTAIPFEPKWLRVFSVILSPKM